VGGPLPALPKRGSPSRSWIRRATRSMYSGGVEMALIGTYLRLGGGSTRTPPPAGSVRSGAAMRTPSWPPSRFGGGPTYWRPRSAGAFDGASSKVRAASEPPPEARAEPQSAVPARRPFVSRYFEPINPAAPTRATTIAISPPFAIVCLLPRRKKYSKVAATTTTSAMRPPSNGTSASWSAPANDRGEPVVADEEENY
jgi:hypothetical protein